jgi:hypothetical protein
LKERRSEALEIMQVCGVYGNMQGKLYVLEILDL